MNEPDRSYAYWAGYLAEHLRCVLDPWGPEADKDLARAALAEFDACCAERDGSIATAEENS